MFYFCSVHLQSKRDQEVDTYIILDKSLFGENETPNLTKEILLKSKQYADFIEMYKKPKIVVAEYTVYSTDEKISEDSQEDYLKEIIENKQAERVASSELNIDCARDKLSGKRRKRISPVKVVGLVGGMLVVGVIGAGGGMKLAQNKAAKAAEQAMIDELGTSDEDGMIIPKQESISADAEQVTVMIDRSYLAVPTEDLQLKGEKKNGAAMITLPEFDKSDFFSHVPGYTWGFSTKQNADKIEYYGGQTYSFDRDTKLYRVLVKYGGGSGTKEDPYIIDYYDQLELMSEEKARGYFKQTADLEFPEWATHNSIDTVMELEQGQPSEIFSYDGGGYRISGLDNPLFGKVSGAVIENVNVTNSFINTTIDKNYGFIVCETYNYSYSIDEPPMFKTFDDVTTDDEDVIENTNVFTTGETVIKHCTVSHSAIRAEYPKTEEDENKKKTVNVTKGTVADEEEKPPVTKKAEHYIGAVTGIGGQIEDCYVTDFGVYANLDSYFLDVGGISGKPANVVNSAVYFFSAQGNIFNAGGIAGSCSGARMYNQLGQELPDYYGGNIQGCVARKIIIESEKAAGGIAGEGGNNVDERAIISNSYCTELDFKVGIYEDDERTVPVRLGVKGGVIGTDSGMHGHYIMNTVSPADLSVIGSKTQSSYDETVRIAPDYAYYQKTILNVINASSANPNTPREIYTGSFEFGSSETFGGDSGSLPYPSQIADLFEKTVEQEDNTDNQEVKNNE